MNDLRNQDSLKNRTAHGNTLAYLQKHRGTRQYRHAPSASRATNKILRPLSRKFGPGVSSLRSHWAEIIGERWAALSKPIAIRGATGAKTLHIEAKGPAAAMLQADSANIQAKVNQFLGAGAISKIVVKQGRIQAITEKTTIAKKPISRDLKQNCDSDLKAVLNKFGNSIQSRKT